MRHLQGMPAYCFAGITYGLLTWWFCKLEQIWGVVIAWLICLTPIVTGRVARKLSVRKKTANRGLIAFPTGMLQRLAWTLLAATLAYFLFERQLGVSYWIAIVVFYQTALVVRTQDQLSSLQA